MTPKGFVMYKHAGKSKGGKRGIAISSKIIPPLFKNLSFQRCVIVVGLCLALTFFLSPQLDFGVPEYKVGSIAIKDVKADRDFLVEDRASTEQKKTDALKEVPPIYDYDKKMPAKIGISLSGIFLHAEKELQENKGIKKIQQSVKTRFENDLRASIADSELKELTGKKFSFHICNNIVKLIYSAYEQRFIGDESLSGSPKSTHIIVHDIDTEKEIHLKDLSSILTMEDVSSLLRTRAITLLADEDKKVRKLSLSVAEKLIRPNITFAKYATEQRKNETLATVKPVFYKVLKNEMIVREGQKMTAVDLEKLNTLSKNEHESWSIHTSLLVGMFIIFMILSILLFNISKNWSASLKRSNIDPLFMALIVLLQIILVKAGIFIAEAMDSSLQFVPLDAYFYAIPFTAGAMLIAVMLGSKEMGLIFSLFTSFLITFLFQDKAGMFIYSLGGSIVASYYLIHCKQRSAFFKAGLLVGLVNCLIMTALALLTGKFLNTETVFKLFMAIMGGIGSGIIVSGTIPLFETLFGYKTDIKLLELANLNQPIFQEMIISAPGTYHHSIIVASMVEAAAEEIFANPLLAKVSAYYHDIGKMKKPLYFVENQQTWENKHDKLTPSMSSRVIISHVKDGCEMARKLKLGSQIEDIIRQHHGTRLAMYFYEKAKKEQDRSRHVILESDFRYPGPKPQSKEAGLVLIADSVEASSRTLKDPTPTRIRALVNARIREIVEDGQLAESELTFSDLHKIAGSFTRILNGIFHHRIEYIDTDKGYKNEEKNGHTRKKPTIKNIRKSLRVTTGTPTHYGTT